MLVFQGCDNSGQPKSSLSSTKPTTSPESNSAESNESTRPEAVGLGKEGASKDSVSSAAAAKTILDACFAKYKQLKSYQDKGILKIRYRVGDRPFTKSEPMQVAFEPANRLALKSIGLQSTWTNFTWEAIFSADSGSPFGKQRVVRPRPDKIDLRWLIVDNLGDLLDNRVTGPPIALNLLLEDKPLAAFLSDQSVSISLLKPDTFDSALCDRIQLQTKNPSSQGESKWVLWIDRTERLLRKFELPIELLTLLNPDATVGQDSAQSELSMELVDAKADAAINWAEWDLPRSNEDLLVSRFVDAPLHQEPRQLGKVLKAFDLHDADRKMILDSAQRSKPITVLCWVGNDELSERFVKYAMEMVRDLKTKSINGYVDWVFVSKSPGGEMQSAFKRWNCDLPLAIDADNLTESVFGVSKHPAIVVLDKEVRVQHIDEIGYLEQLPEILNSIHDGVQLAARKLQVQIDNQARYVSRLHRATIDRTQSENLAPIDPFPMVYHELQRVWQTKLETKIIAAGGEQFFPLARSPWSANDVFETKATSLRVMIVLDEFGDVYAIDNSGNRVLVAKIPIDKANNAKRIHIATDPWTHQWVAIIPEGLPRYWLFEMPINMKKGEAFSTKEPTEFVLDEKESPSVFAWSVQGSKPSLIVATSSGRLHVLDPVRGKALSGQTNGVVGIVPTLNDRGECIGWNAIDPAGLLSPIDNLPSDGDLPSSAPSSDPAIKSIPIPPELGQWTWGRNHSESLLVGLGKLPSGETGAVLHSMQFEPIFTHPLSVRAEQCRILGSATLSNGNFYWISTAPRRVLHLQTKNGPLPDQMSLGKSVLGASLLPDDVHLRLTLAVDDEVSCWRIVIPQLPAENASPTPASTSIERPGASEKRVE
jgi:hypothetical protein